ncbi:Peroxisomal multifunctional enzyme type 2 [Leucoagaricus sp. SymC.cos]|nr:Peroxisomal multifunctional enzyme type 2 [Leucoagaricus sp. SymC.cos]
MSDDIRVTGFKSSELIVGLQTGFTKISDSEKQNLIKKTNGIFELQVTKGEETATWTIDAKKTGTVYKGKATPKADVTIILADDVLVDLAEGKASHLRLFSFSFLSSNSIILQLNGQKAFMTGKLKTRGNIMLATKLDNVLKTAKEKAKL